MFGITPLLTARQAAVRSAPLLRVRDLTVEFPTRRGLARAVSGVSFDVAAGERLAIVGESGSGKSVTALSLLKLLPFPGRIAGGSAELDGRDVLSLQGRELRALHDVGVEGEAVR